MLKKVRHEAHVVEFPAGHKLSIDCWCEPSEIFWADTDGEKVLVINHRDDTNNHHKVIIAERNHRQDWITRVLNSVKPPTPKIKRKPNAPKKNPDE